MLKNMSGLSIFLAMTPKKSIVETVGLLLKATLQHGLQQCSIRVGGVFPFHLMYAIIQQFELKHHEIQGYKTLCNNVGMNQAH